MTSEGYSYEERAHMTKETILLEPASVRAFYTHMHGKMPFYRAVNSAIQFFIAVYTAQHGDEIDLPVPQKVGKIKVVVKR